MNSDLIFIIFFSFYIKGKSSITVQFVENHFVDSYNPTIENTFQKRLRYRGNDYDIRIVDTAGAV